MLSVVALVFSSLGVLKIVRIAVHICGDKKQLQAKSTMLDNCTNFAVS